MGAPETQTVAGIDPVQERAEIIQKGFRGLSLIESIIHESNPEFAHQSDEEKAAAADVRSALNELVMVHNSSLPMRRA